MSWRDDAACRDMDNSIFFPEPGHSCDHAKSICGGCDVRVQCLAEAMQGDEYGVWGGLTRDERIRVKRKRNRVKAPERTRECVWCGKTFVRDMKKPGVKTCSPYCRKLHERRYQRQYQRDLPERVPGTMLEDSHGTISMYQGGCRCPACAAASRERRAIYRTRSA